jgi:prenyltransferase beta subunit
MLQVARLAPRQLSDAADLVVGFIESQAHPEGGFRNRAGDADLYYSVFGLECLAALRAELPVDLTVSYLRRFGDGASLDLVHLACLARCWANMPPARLDPQCRGEMLRRLDAFATPTIYSCFLIAGAYQDLGAPVPRPHDLVATIQRLAGEDGGFGTHAAGTTPTAAAAATLVRYFGETADPQVGRWLRARCHPDGGFFASPSAPIPDLLSTATALHALVGLHEPIDDIRDPCLDFIDTLWTSRGGFYGSWADEVLDCEYTYYGLLALGHLSL